MTEGSANRRAGPRPLRASTLACPVVPHALFRRIGSLALAWAISLAVGLAPRVGAAEPGAVEVGDELLPDWTVSDVLTHPEFQRMTVTGPGGASHALEVTLGSIAGDDDAVFLVQPAPGHSPPPELIEALRGRLESGAAPVLFEAPPDYGVRFAEVRAPPLFWASNDARIMGVSYYQLVTWVSVLWLLLAAPLGASAVARSVLQVWRRSPRPRRNLAICAVAAVAFLGLFRWLTPEIAVDWDTFRDIRIGWECVHGLECRAGPGTAQALMAQGTLWPRFLAGLFGAGYTLADLPHVLVTLDGIAAGLLFAWCWHRSGGALPALAITLVWVALVIVTESLRLPWNPSIVPLTGVAFAIASTAAMDNRSVSSAMVAGAAMAMLIESHIVAAALAFPWAISVVMTSHQPARTLAAATATTWALHWILSPLAATREIVAIVEHGLTWPLVEAVVLGLAAGAYARRWSPGPATGLALILASEAVVVIGAMAVLGFFMAPRYLGPLVGIGAAALAEAVTVWRRQRPASKHLNIIAAAVILAAIPGLRRNVVEPWQLTLRGVEPLMEVLDRVGGGADLLLGTHSLTPRLLAAMEGALHFPSRPATPPDNAVTILFGEGTAPDVPSDWEAVSYGSRHALVHAYEPWVRRRDAVVCGATADSEPSCLPVETLRLRDQQRLRYLSPAITLGTIIRGTAEGYDPERFEFPVRAGRRGESRVIAMFVPDGYWVDCDPQIVAVTGVDYVGELPAKRIELLGGRAEGRLVVTISDECRSFDSQLPTWAEFEPGDPWIEPYLTMAADL